MCLAVWNVFNWPLLDEFGGVKLILTFFGEPKFKTRLIAKRNHFTTFGAKHVLRVTRTEPSPNSSLFRLIRLSSQASGGPRYESRRLRVQAVIIHNREEQ